MPLNHGSYYQVILVTDPVAIVALTIGGLMAVWIVWLSLNLLGRVLPAEKTRGWTIAAALFLLLIFMAWLALLAPVPESRVLEVATPGVSVEKMVSLIGEPHEKYMNEDGSGTFHYYGDWIGLTGIGVVVSADGTVDGTWVD